MTDIFARLAARATGQGPTRAEPRTVPFESGAATPVIGDPWESGSRPDPPRPAADPPGEAPHTRSAELDDEAPRWRPAPGTDTHRDQAGAYPVGVDAARRAGTEVRADEPTDPRGAVAAAQDRITAIARHLSGPAVHSEQRSSAPDHGLAQSRTDRGGDPPKVDGVSGSAEPRTGAGQAGAASGAVDGAAGATARQPTIAPAPKSRTIWADGAGPGPTATATTSEPDARPGPGGAAPPSPRVARAPTSGGQPSSGRAAGRAITPETFLRDHLGPALAHLGAITERDRHALVPVPTDAPERPIPHGAVAVGVDAVELPASGELHVHIGRVEITRAQAAQAPDSPRSVRSAPDHAAYLARQQDRWRR